MSTFAILYVTDLDDPHEVIRAMCPERDVTRRGAAYVASAEDLELVASRPPTPNFVARTIGIEPRVSVYCAMNKLDVGSSFESLQFALVRLLASTTCDVALRYFDDVILVRRSGHVTYAAEYSDVVTEAGWTPAPASDLAPKREGHE